MRFLIILSGVICFLSCHEKGPADPQIVKVDTVIISDESTDLLEEFYSRLSEDYFFSAGEGLIKNYDGDIIRALARSGPAKVFPEITGEDTIYYVMGIGDVINRNPKVRSANKLLKFKMPLDSMLPYLESEQWKSFYFLSWGEIYEATGNKFVVDSSYMLKERSKVYMKLEGFNLNYVHQGIDSLNIGRVSFYDMLEEEFSVVVQISNQSQSTVESVEIAFSANEYAGSRDTAIIASYEYPDINILPEPLPPKTYFWLVKKFPNPHYRPSDKYELRYFDFPWDLIYAMEES